MGLNCLHFLVKLSKRAFQLVKDVVYAKITVNILAVRSFFIAHFYFLSSLSHAQFHLPLVSFPVVNFFFAVSYANLLFIKPKVPRACFVLRSLRRLRGCLYRGSIALLAAARIDQRGWTASKNVPRVLNILQ